MKSNQKNVGLWLPEETKWPDKLPLKVYFMDAPNWYKWNPHGIIGKVNEIWTDCFVLESERENAQIRVKCGGMCLIFGGNFV